MRIFICCSKYIYDRIHPIKEKLESKGHLITLPNSYEEPMAEERIKAGGKEEHENWKANMIRLQKEKISVNDAILVLNMEKKGIKNYIGGATFLEMSKAWELGKKIFLFNDIPENIMQDEICAFKPIIINQNLDNIK
ncbi:hypothetical protein J4461_01350 [Candidatus Pacearchaeota archaeon]|nr:hypothetical protein [Candidatus Pacearchaeota archaeon]